MQPIRFGVLGFCLMIAPFARAEQWSKTYSIAGKPELRVETSDANIRVDTWDRNTIEARVTTDRYKIGEHDIRIEEHQSGDSVDIEVHYPRPHVSVVFFSLNGRESRVEIEIHMPRQGRISLRTGDGHIEVLNFKGEMSLESGDGHQNLEGVEGTLRARAGDGHITAAGRFDMLDMRTGDGAIEVRALPGSKPASDWELRAGDGSVTLKLPDNFAADLELETGDGHITLDMPLSVEGRLGKKIVHGKLNGGGKLLMVHTGDGSIHLEKS
jgi:DUF4097 and DUF4098 domain-containing protein YvlB